MAGLSFCPVYYLDAELLSKIIVLGLAFNSAVSVVTAWVSMNSFICQSLLHIVVEYETASAVNVALDLIPLSVKDCAVML